MLLYMHGQVLREVISIANSKMTKTGVKWNWKTTHDVFYYQSFIFEIAINVVLMWLLLQVIP